MTEHAIPLFTVLIPTHNRAKIIRRAIQSVLNQTCQDFEILIVDDASTDETETVIHSLADSRIRYVRRDVNGGAGATRNTGIRNCRTPYICFLDDDDEYLPDFLEEMRNAFDGAPETTGFAWCGIRWVKETENEERVIKDEIWHPQYVNREQAYLSFLRHRRIGTNCGITLRRSIFEVAQPFDEEFRGGAEDNDFIIRLVRLFDFIVVPKILIKVHLHPGLNLRAYTARKAEDYQRLIAKNLDALKKYPDAWRALHYKAGWLHYHGGKRDLGRRYIWMSLKAAPLSLKSWSALIFFETLGRFGPALHKKISTLKRVAHLGPRKIVQYPPDAIVHEGKGSK